MIDQLMKSFAVRVRGPDATTSQEIPLREYACVTNPARFGIDCTDGTQPKPLGAPFDKLSIPSKKIMLQRRYPFHPRDCRISRIASGP